MTIDEAIAQARKKANEMYTQGMLCHANPNDEKLDGIIDCAREQEQLAEWLEELKMYKSLAPRELVSEKQKNDRAMEYSKGFDYGFKTGYAKAIDDFAEKAIQEFTRFDIKHGYPTVADCKDVLQDVAEQLKAGDTDAESI